jgi:hypothetical protein
MAMKPSQEKRFYKVLDALLDYANELYGLIDHPMYPGTATFEKDQAVLLRSVWNDRSIIDSFIEANPAKLTRSDLNTVKDWKHALTGRFTLVKHEGGYSYLMLDHKAYAVMGIFTEISTMMPDPPVIVATTLLPFEGLITYDSQMNKYPVGLTDSMSRVLADEFEAIVAKGDVYKSAQALIRNVPYHLEEGRQRELDRKIDEYQREKRALDPAGSMPEGYYMGRLSTVSFADREAVIAAELEAERGAQATQASGGGGTASGPPALIGRSRRHMLASVRKGEPDRDLRTAFGLLTKDKLVDLARLVQIPNRHQMRKAELIERLCDAPPVFFSGIISSYMLVATDSDIEVLDDLANNGGRLDYDAADLLAPPILPDNPPAFYHWRNGDTISTVMPEQFVQAYQQADRELLLSERVDINRLIELANAAAELYGIITLYGFSELYASYYPEARSTPEMQFIMLMDLDGSPEASYCIWADREAAARNADDGLKALIDSLYIVHYELAEHRHRLADDGGDDIEADEDLRLWRSYLIKRHQEIGRKALDVGQLAGFDLFAYCRELEPVQALIHYLDTYVPEDKDDLFFADEMVDMIIGAIQYDDNLAYCLEDLNDAGFNLATIEMMGDFVALLTEAMNAIPRWSNNGHSPRELADLYESRRSRLRIL